MRIVTINMPESYLRIIEKLTKKDGMFPSRSELVRYAVKQFLVKELNGLNFKKYSKKKSKKEKVDPKYVQVGNETFRIIQKPNQP